MVGYWIEKDMDLPAGSGTAFANPFGAGISAFGRQSEKRMLEGITGASGMATVDEKCVGFCHWIGFVRKRYVE